MHAPYLIPLYRHNIERLIHSASSPGTGFPKVASERMLFHFSPPLFSFLSNQPSKHILSPPSALHHPSPRPPAYPHVPPPPPRPCLFWALSRQSSSLAANLLCSGWMRSAFLRFDSRSVGATLKKLGAASTSHYGGEMSVNSK